MELKRTRQRRQFDHELAVAARARVLQIIDQIPPVDLVAAIKRAPSLRGMILGYVAEELFERYLEKTYKGISNIEKHDDHDRSVNKSDRTITHGSRRYSIQLKSLQTNTIHYSHDHTCVIADLQNDASDRRKIKLPNGSTVETTCYAVGDYDILAVPLFPFSGKWNYAYKRNYDCRRTVSAKYSEKDRKYLLATTERITYPVGHGWTTDLMQMLDGKLGKPVKHSAN